MVSLTFIATSLDNVAVLGVAAQALRIKGQDESAAETQPHAPSEPAESHDQPIETLAPSVSRHRTLP